MVLLKTELLGLNLRNSMSKKLGMKGPRLVIKGGGSKKPKISVT